MIDSVSPETWVKAAASLLFIFGLIEAVLWFGLWRDEKRYVYISQDSARRCLRQFRQSLLIAAIGAGVYALVHYYGGLL